MTSHSVEQAGGNRAGLLNRDDGHFLPAARTDSEMIKRLSGRRKPLIARALITSPPTTWLPSRQQVSDAPNIATINSNLGALSRSRAAHVLATISRNSRFLPAFSPGHDRRVVVSDAHRQNAARPAPDAFASASLDEQYSSHRAVLGSCGFHRGRARR
jgi:hypothetical protein